MISDMVVRNYRSFETYQVSGLQRVNLFTGFNNSGKTSLLEAAAILASGGDIAEIWRILSQRGEYIFLPDEDRRPVRFEAQPDLSHLFFGHEYELDQPFMIETKDRNFGTVTVSVTNRAKLRELQLFDKSAQDGNEYLLVKRSGHRFLEDALIMPLSADGKFYSSEAMSRVRRRATSENSIRQTFISPDSLSVSEMASMWDGATLEGLEASVIDALKIIDPAVRDVVFLSGNRYSRVDKAGVVFGREGATKRFPMGSFGEGSRRLLALSLALTSVPAGFVFVDEIDTGLHYSVLADMWKLVIGTAIKNDIQVFATTHSLDCLRGLNEACERDPELASEISTQTIDRNLDVAIAGDATDLRSALDLGIEVR